MFNKIFIVIEVKNLNKIYSINKKRNSRGLVNASFVLPSSGFVFILGKSGSGKSTLINLLGDLDSKTSGDILIDGESTNPEKIYEIVTKILNNEEVNAEEFERSKKRLYGEFVTNFEDVEQIGRMFIQDALRNVDTIDYINQLKNITLEEVNDIKNKIFKSEESILSIVRNKN